MSAETPETDKARKDAEDFFKAGFDAGVASCYDPTGPSDVEKALAQYIIIKKDV